MSSGCGWVGFICLEYVRRSAARSFLIDGSKYRLYAEAFSLARTVASCWGPQQDAIENNERGRGV